MVNSVNKENFKKLMENELLQLPIRWDGKNFEGSLKHLYFTYINELKSLFTQDTSNIDEICNKLLESVKNYHNGFPSLALIELNSIMDILIKNPLKIYNKNGWINPFRNTEPLYLFRIRNVYNNINYCRKDIFHIPYCLRSQIATCRYSIAGYPSLYLGTSLQLCCEEAKLSSFNDLRIASRFEIKQNIENETNMPIKVIEMGIKPKHFLYYYDRKNNLTNQLEVVNRKESKIYERYLREINLLNKNIMYSYLYWYPLIAACSYIRTNNSNPFASEYIIPQLLMQWVRNKSSNNTLYGIRYFSCTSINASDLGFNYVFPASSTRYKEDNNFCEILANSFLLTKPHYINDYNNLDDCENNLKKDNNVKTI